MRQPRIRTIEEFEDWLEKRPSRLGCWRAGADGRYPLLAWLNAHPINELRKLSSAVGVRSAAAMTNSAFHNQVGIAAGWITRHMNGDARETTNADRIALFNCAGAYWELRNAMVEVRAGARRFHSNGRVVRLAYAGNHNIDSLDRMLDLSEVLTEMNSITGIRNPQLRDWLQTEGLKKPWWTAPLWVRQAFERQASHALDSYPRYLPDHATMAGLRVRDVDKVWEQLLAWGMYMHGAIILGSGHLPTIVPALDPGDVVALLAETSGVEPSTVRRLVDLLTLDLERCHDPALTPFVPFDELLVPMSSLIVPTSPRRNLLAILQSDPATFGEAGRLLGIEGERAAVDVLARLDPECRVARRVPVLRPNGRRAGDYDVVVREDSSRTIAIFELKWGISADGNAEVYRSEKQAIEKRTQVVALRKEVLAGTAAPRWPSDWPVVENYKTRWFILTRDVLPMRNIDDEGVTIRSVQYLARTLKAGAPLDQLLSLLDNPPVPPKPLQQTEWTRIRFGDVAVEVEHLRA
jgi:hypothetical protein